MMHNTYLSILCSDKGANLEEWSDPMSETKICPICGSEAEQFNVEEDVIEFLFKLQKEDMLNEYLRIAKVYLDILKQGAPTTAVVSKIASTMRSEIKKTTTTELSALSEELPSKIEEILKDKIPDSEQVKALAIVLPKLTLTIQELLRKQEVPQKKGEIGEQELADELCCYFPEDEIERLGGPGRTDIVVKPRITGRAIGEDIIIESKKNKAWKRAFVEEVQKHMAARRCRYAILAVDTMPKGANEYMTEFVQEGTIFVTSRENCKIAYGALRAILSSEHMLGRRAVNLQIALSDARIQDAIRSAFDTTEHLESIRKRAKSIISGAKKITSDADEIEDTIRTSLKQLQSTIQETIIEMHPEDEKQETVTSTQINKP